MRLFAAVWPDAAARRRIARIDLRRSPHLRPTPAGQWHVTLRFLGEVADDLVPPLRSGLAAATAAWTAPVGCEMGPATAWFSGGRVLHLPVRGLEAMASMVRQATDVVVPPGRRPEPPFVGHLTVARSDRRGVGPMDAVALEGTPCTAAWRVDSFDLVVSEHTPTGVRYTTLARFPLLAVSR